MQSTEQSSKASISQRCYHETPSVAEVLVTVHELRVDHTCCDLHCHVLLFLAKTIILNMKLDKNRPTKSYFMLYSGQVELVNSSGFIEALFASYSLIKLLHVPPSSTVSVIAS